MGARIERVRKHLRENRKVYLACGGTAVVAVVGTVLATSRRSDVSNVATAIGLWRCRAEVNNVSIELVERSTPSKPVHLKGTNLYFDSLSDAARKTGHSLSSISKQINGHVPDVGGDVFEVLQPAA